MRKTLIILIFLTIALSGCAKLRPYQVDVQQGNVIDAKAVAQLELGMNKNQVQSILGSSMLANTFDDSTWTYAYTNQINGGKIEKKTLILHFQNNKLSTIEQH